MTWYTIKEGNTVSRISEEKLFADLAAIGVTETTGSSEMFEDGWVLYCGDSNQTILAKEIQPDDLVDTTESDVTQA